MTRWHRLLGIASVVIVILTTVSGIVLNHTDRLGLGQRPIDSVFINRHYGHELGELDAAFEIEGQWIAQSVGQVIAQGREVYRQEGQLLGALRHEQAILLLFPSALVHFDEQFQLVDVYGELDGLQAPLRRIGTAKGKPVVEDNQGLLAVDLNAAAFNPLAVDASPNWSSSQIPPATVQAEVRAIAGASGVSTERVLLDFHSGRAFGPLGVLIVDLSAVALLFLAISGVYMWFKFKRGNGRVPRRPDAPKPPP